MENLWNDTEAGKHKGILAERVYSSRLLGANTNLVLHGGGNTSVKGTSKNIFGEDVATLFVKGSGSDLATIEAKDFVAVRLDSMLKLARLEKLSDIDMARELKLASLDPAAPAPSVEAILHALIPHRFVDHTHADAIVAITNTGGTSTADGEARIRGIYGDEVIVLPYVMPGFDLARLCAEVFPKLATARTIGMVLMNHGIFSFGDTAKQAYDRMIALVGRAEDYLNKNASLPAQPEASSTANWAGLPGFFFSSRRRHTRSFGDWSSDVCSSDLSDPTDCSLPGSSVHGIFQARILEWGAIAFSDACYTDYPFPHAFPNTHCVFITH